MNNIMTNKARVKYLLKKEQVAGIDKAEVYELQELLNEVSSL